MSKQKRERQRRKRAAKLKKQARAKAQQRETESRQWRSYELADEADAHLKRGEIAEALRDAARAAEFNPGDPGIARLYLVAAGEAHDFVEQARALEIVTKTAVPDARLFAQLAYLHLQNGNGERAHEVARRARAILPPRMKNRKELVALIEHVTAASARLAAATRSLDEQPSFPLDSSLRRAPRPPDAVSSVEAAPVEAVPAEKSEPPMWLEIPVDIAPDVDGLEVLSSASFADPEEVSLAILAARLRDAE